MPLSDDQKNKLKNMSAEDRAELLEALGMKSSASDSDILKSVEILQGKVEKLEKAATRKPGEDRRKSGAGSWFDAIFGGA